MGLVLTRNYGERIHIGNDIVVAVAKCGRHGQVQLWIDAPRHINIAREELVHVHVSTDGSGRTDPACDADLDGVGNIANTDHATLKRIADITSAALHVDSGARRYADALSAIGQLLDERG